MSTRKTFALALSLTALTVLACNACNAILGIEELPPEPADGGREAATDAFVDTSPTVDAGGDVLTDAATEAEAGPPLCDVTKEFQAPVEVTELNTGDRQGAARLSNDELTIYFDALRDGDFKILTATRATKSSPWGTPVELEGIQSAANEYAPAIRQDGLQIFFERLVPGPANRIFNATRVSTAVSFGNPVEVANVNSGAYTANPFTRGNATELWYVNGVTPPIQIMHAVFVAGTGFTTSVVDHVNIGNGQFSPVISSNGLVLYFASDKTTAGFAGQNIWVSTRNTTSADFTAPLVVGALSSDGDDRPTWISDDGCRMYISSTRSGGTGTLNIYRAERPL